MSVLPRLQVGSWSAFAGPAVPIGGTFTGPASTVDESSVAVSWRASGTVKVSLVGASTITVGSGPGGDVRLTVPNGRYAFTVENTSGSALASFEVSMRAADRIGDLVGAITDTGGQVVNVKAFGATGDGVTDDTDAINAAMSAAVAVNGAVYFPAGTYVCNGATSPARDTGWIEISGAGRDATILQSNAAGDHTFKLSMPGRISDLTVDAGAIATNALELITAGPTLSYVQLDNVSCGNTGTDGGWVLVAWDTSQTWKFERLQLNGVWLYGPTNPSADAAAVSFVRTVVVNDMRIFGVGRTPNFFYIKDLQVDGLDVSDVTDGSPAGLVFDTGVQQLRASRITTDGSAPTAIWAGESRIELSTFRCAVNCGSDPGSSVEFHDCDIEGNGASAISTSGLAVAEPSCQVRVFGGRLSAGTGGATGAVMLNTPADSVVDGLELHNVVIDSPNNNRVVIGANSGITLSHFVMDGCAGLSPGRLISDATTTDASATVTTTSDQFTSNDVGRSVTGAGIPSGTTIDSVQSATQITLSAAATASAVNTAISLGDLRYDISFDSAALDGTCRVSNTEGYNPATVTTPSVPAASTAVTNDTGVDIDAYITGGAGGTTSVNGISTGIGNGTFFVPAGGTIDLGAYTTAPTWVWVGR